MKSIEFQVKKQKKLLISQQNLYNNANIYTALYTEQSALQ